MTNSKYDQRLHRFLRRIKAVSRLVPREKYLYPIMDGVPFKDLETALMMAIIAFKEATNDNRQAK